MIGSLDKAAGSAMSQERMTQRPGDVCRWMHYFDGDFRPWSLSSLDERA